MLTVWKVGCPHGGDVPSPELPDSFRERASASGLTAQVECWPAKDFHDVFQQALTDGRLPDLLVIDNYGILKGIETALGTFTGIATVLASDRFVFVTTTLDDLKGPRGGWVMAIRDSPNHQFAVKLASNRPNAPSTWRISQNPSEGLDQLHAVADAATRAHLNRQAHALYPLLDADHMVVHSPAEGCDGRASAGCEVVDLAVVRTWGNDRIAFCGLAYSWPEAGPQIGGGYAVAALRRPNDAADAWKVLFVSTDPISIDQLAGPIPDLADDLRRDSQSPCVPSTLLSPLNGEYPELTPDDVFEDGDDERFGFFRWRRNPGGPLLAEIVEFTSCETPLSEPRVILLRRNLDRSIGQFSSGWLWTTGCRWQWRVWSIGLDGTLAFSDHREFWN